MSEVWKDIEGYEGKYEVSSYGRVRSLEHSISLRNQHGEYVRKLSERIIKQKRNRKDGYFNVTLCKRAEHSTAYVHRLVAQAFIPNPDNLPQINHKNEQRDDNRVDNLEWCTGTYNMYYNGRSKRIAIANGKPVEQLSMDGHFIRTFPSIREAARSVNGDMKSIRMCCKKDTMTHYYKGYRWKFKE